MYSYEERIRAVKLYIKLGGRLHATIRELGYPTRNALKGWHREYIQNKDLRSDYVRLRQKYSKKQVAVEHFIAHGQCMAFTMRTLGYPSREALTDWINELY